MRRAIGYLIIAFGIAGCGDAVVHCAPCPGNVAVDVPSLTPAGEGSRVLHYCLDDRCGAMTIDVSPNTGRYWSIPLSSGDAVTRVRVEVVDAGGSTIRVAEGRDVRVPDQPASGDEDCSCPSWALRYNPGTDSLEIAEQLVG